MNTSRATTTLTPTGSMRLTEARDNDSIVDLTYDSLSRVKTEVQGSNPLGGTGKTTGYTYDAEGNRVKIDYASGFDANEARDALGRVTAITDGSSASVASFDLCGRGLRKKKTTFGNGTTSNYTYDGFRRPADIAHKTSAPATFAGFTYAWDKNDNPLYEIQSHNAGKGPVYQYDQANRLVKVLTDCDDPAAEIATPGSEAYAKKLEYDMDDVFNLTAYKVTPYGGGTSTTSFTADAMNLYTAVGAASPTYTDAGSLEDDGAYEYVYDVHQRLIEVKDSTSHATIATYQYDALGLGRRTKKTVGANSTRYVYAGQQSIEEHDGSNNLLRLFVFGQRIDDVVMMEAPDRADVDSDANTSELQRFYYHSQLVGSVTQITGPSQAVVESYLYDPYGKPTIKDQGGSPAGNSPIGNPYLFTARQLDEESGLYYFRARHYSAELKRFIQRDHPSEYADGPNAYMYCHASPSRRTDPLGLDDDESGSAAGDAKSAADAAALALKIKNGYDRACRAIDYGNSLNGQMVQGVDVSAQRIQAIGEGIGGGLDMFSWTLPSDPVDAVLGWFKKKCGEQVKKKEPIPGGFGPLPPPGAGAMIADVPYRPAPTTGGEKSFGKWLRDEAAKIIDWWF